MTGRILTVSGLVALAHAKAIITNNCLQPAYIWSVPNVGSAHTDNLPIQPGGRYEEPWRYGTSQHPGIALKISDQADGIHKGASEINFAYSIEHSDKSKIWVDLSPVRGVEGPAVLSFHSCNDVFQSVNVPTHQCDATDDVELVLCGSKRSAPAKDWNSPQMISECYDYHHDNSKYDDFDSDDPKLDGKPSYTQSSKSSTHMSTKPSTSPAHPCGQCPPVKPTAHETYSKPHKSTSSVSYHEPPKYTSSQLYHQPPKYTSETYHEPPKYTSTEPYHEPPKYTSSEPYHEPPKYTSSELYHVPPKYTSEEQYHEPPKYTSNQPYDPPQKHITTTTTVTMHTTVFKPGKDQTVTYHAPPHFTTVTYKAPPKYTSEAQYAPPKTTPQPYAPPPKYTSEKTYAPPISTHSYAALPKYTSTSIDYDVPHRPSYHFPGDRPGRPTKPIEEDYYDAPRPTYQGGDRLPPRANVLCNKRAGDVPSGCPAPMRRSHDYCLPKVIYPMSLRKLRDANSTAAAPRTLMTVPLGTAVRQETSKPQVAATSTIKLGHGPVPHASTPAKPKLTVRRAPFEETTTFCLVEFCGDFAIDKEACKKFEKVLDAVAKTGGENVNFSTDPVKCSTERALRAGKAQIFRFLQDTPKVCITPFCKDKSEDECKQLEKDLERAAKDNGDIIDFTTDPAVCRTI